jgi:hypothetical protein
LLGQYWYHGIFRKSIVSFGTLFNNIAIKRKKGTTTQLETLKVPLKYGPTQKYLAIIAAEPTPERQQFQITLPRMSFEIKGITYDPSRKATPTQFIKTVPPEGSTKDGRPVQYSQYLPVPYNLDMELSIIAKNQDDGLQILEQILPNFHPSLNVSIQIIEETKEERDIAIVLNSIDYQDIYEGDFSERRALLWTLRFSLKTYLFGPVNTHRDIRKVIVDYRSDVVRRAAEVRYTAEVESTDTPPIPRDQINPETDGYKIVENYEDVDSEFFGV